MSCTKDNDLEIDITDLTISAEVISISIDDTTQLSIVTTPAQAEDNEVTWSSSDDTIATVDANGVVTGLETGQVIITATSTANSNITDTVTLEITGVKSNDITALSIMGIEGTIADNTITVDLISGTDITALSPEITITGATVSPASGTPQDFSNGVTYIVIAESGDTQEYTVQINFTDTTVSGTEFITTWSGTEFTIRTNQSFSYSYNIDTDNDGTVNVTGITGDYTLTFEDEGPHTIRISGNFPAIKLNNDYNSAQALTEINQWGDIQWKSMEYAFYYCSNLEVLATDIPDLSNTPSMYGMFMFCSLANPDVSDWDTSNVTNMSYLFYSASVATPNVSNWDVSKVQQINYMFGYCPLAAPDVSNWDTSNVTNMNGLFYNCEIANPDTSNWDVSNVTNVSNMFQGCAIADPDVSSWDTSNITTMSSMFRGATIAQPDTSNWNTSKVTNMSSMFRDALAAQPDTSNWDISEVTTMFYMFYNVTLPTSVYDAILFDFASKPRQTEVYFHGGNSVYCAAGTERTELENNTSWIIADGGLCAP